MVALGYNEQLGAAQPFAVALNMRYLVAWMYLVSAILMYVGIRLVYNLDKAALKEMNVALGYQTAEEA
jgi:GPH family glycoside/pentoside/hexuronide:cation symporter